MKKILYLVLFALCTLLLIGCDDETAGRTFSMELVSATPYREKIVFEFNLNDPDKQLKKSDVKGIISKAGSDSILSTKTLSFDSNNYEEISFTGLNADTPYSVEFYTSFNGKKVTLLKEEYRTTNEGTIENPYPISEFADLKKIRQEPTGHFKLTKDIDCDEQNISPLLQSTAFTGTIDGKKEDESGNYLGNYKIFDFTLGTKDEQGNYSHVASRDQYHGFFGNIGTGAKVSNIDFENFNVNVSRDKNRNDGTYGSSIFYYGILAGVCAGTIENVNVTNSTLNVKSENTNLQVLKVGGLVGNLKENGVIKNVEVDVDIKVESSKDVSVGGIAGTTRDSVILTEKVEGVTQIIPNISNVIYTGDITVVVNGLDSASGNSDDKKISQPSIGGLVGKNVEAIIDNCSANATIKVTSKFTENEGQIIFVGGLVGKNISDKSRVSNCGANVSFEVETYDIPKDENKLNVYVGLFAGQNGGDLGGPAEIKNCTFTPKGENTVKLYDNANVLASFDKVAKAMNGSKLVDSTLVEGTDSVKLVVQKYTKADDSEEYTKVSDTGLSIAR